MKVSIESIRVIHTNHDWGSFGVRAEAVVSYDIGGGNKRLDTLKSGGLFDIGSDSAPEDVKEMEQDELDGLMVHLEMFGVDISDFYIHKNRMRKK